MNRLILFMAVALLTGCASPYSKFYNASGYSPALDQYAITPQGTPEIRTGSDPESDQLRMVEDGYRLIGTSTFNAPSVDSSQALKQAEQVKAAVVIVYSQYSNTVQGAAPLTLPTTNTSYTNMSGMAGGRSFYGNSQTTTYGTQTTYIPYAVRRFDHHATYWLKTRPGILGVFFDEPTAHERRIAGTNKGLIVKAVVKGSPAFKADLFRDDVIYQINHVDVFDRQSFGDALQRFQGEKVSLAIIRDGKEKKIDLQLNPSWR